MEGENLNLHWSYNLNGRSVSSAFITNVTGGVTVVVKQGDSNATIQAGYEHQFSATISDTQATLTILAVPRSVSGEKYRLAVRNTVDFVEIVSVVVEISVLCKYIYRRNRRSFE